MELLERGESRVAIDRLKEARRRYPDEPELVLLLAKAYLAEGNLFWAERVLREGVDRWPEAPEMRSWLAAVHVRQGDPALVADDLDDERAPEGPEGSRWRLLDASRARLEGDREAARSIIGELDAEDVLYPEDRELWASLKAATDPWWAKAVAGTLELGWGRTSNALAGSPTDPGTSGDTSGLVPVELRGRLAPPSRAPLTPVVDLEILGNGLLDDASEDLSSLQAGVRLGGAFAGDRRRWGFGYRAEGLWLDQDEPLFSEAHRGELEIEWAGGGVVFAGAGRRIYRDDARTRWEAEAGAGGPLGELAGAPLLVGATLRYSDARLAAYDQVGVSAAASVTVPTGRRTSLRIALAGAWEDYLNSAGAEGELVFGTSERRRDLLGRAGLTFWAPAWRTWRPAVEVRYTARDSTADEAPGFDFSYREWRVIVRIRWSFSADPWAPQATEEAGHVPLDWGLDDDRGMDQERILDLLRRDEELRRGSSCGLP